VHICFQPLFADILIQYILFALFFTTLENIMSEDLKGKPVLHAPAPATYNCRKKTSQKNKMLRSKMPTNGIPTMHFILRFARACLFHIRTRAPV